MTSIVSTDPIYATFAVDEVTYLRVKAMAEQGKSHLRDQAQAIAGARLVAAALELARRAGAQALELHVDDGTDDRNDTTFGTFGCLNWC